MHRGVSDADVSRSHTKKRQRMESRVPFTRRRFRAEELASEDK